MLYIENDNEIYLRGKRFRNFYYKVGTNLNIQRKRDDSVEIKNELTTQSS